MANTLIVRYERIGDALLVLPLVIDLANKNKTDHFTVLTNKRFDDLIELMPQNVTFIPMVSKTSKGMFRGLSYLKRRWLFLYKTKKLIASFDKVAFFQYGTFEKKLHKYIQNKHKNISVAITEQKDFRSSKRLEHKCNDGLTMVGLHKEALSRIGYLNLDVISEPSAIKNRDISASVIEKTGINAGKILIAISPFSRETPKVYPLDKMEKVIAHLSKHPEVCQVLILGGGEDEKECAEAWAAKYPSVISLINKVSFGEEVSVISKCAVVVSMDSSNMHLASLLHTPVISVWGPTAPQNGYYPAYESLDRAIIKNLDCQPCTIFGENQCPRINQYECMDIEPEFILNRIKQVVAQGIGIIQTKEFFRFIQRTNKAAVEKE